MAWRMSEMSLCQCVLCHGGTNQVAYHTSGALNGVMVEGRVTEIPVTRIRARQGIGILLESYRKISHGHVTPRSNSELP